MIATSPLLVVGLKVLGLAAQQQEEAPIKIRVQRNRLFAIFLMVLSVPFPITSVFGQFPTTGPIIPTTPAAPAAAAPTTTLQSTDSDSFRVQVPDGWVIHDVNNTGSALLEESTRGYGILAQLCPHEEQQQEAALPNVSGRITTNSSSSSISTSNICLGAQEVIHIIRYPDLETRIQAANTVTTNNDMTTDNILSYYLQKLQEVGYRNIQIVASADMTVNITNPQTNQTTATAPAKLLEMTYSTNSAPDETRTGYLISTATDMTPPNLGTTKGYSVFYEGNSTTITEITTAFGSLPPLLPPALGQAFDSFELIAAAEVAQELAQQEAAAQRQSLPVTNTPETTTGGAAETIDDDDGGESACDSSYPDFCIPPSPPDLNCDDVGDTDFRVLSPDPHGFDGDNDGIGCEASVGNSGDESGGGAGDDDDVDEGDDEDGDSSTDTSSSTSSSSGSSSRCPNGTHRSPSGDCERVTDTRGMPRCPNGYHRSPDGDCESVG
jgi:hypothetical protein